MLCKITSGWVQSRPCPLLPLTRNPDDRPTAFRFWLVHRTVIPQATILCNLSPLASILNDSSVTRRLEAP